MPGASLFMIHYLQGAQEHFLKQVDATHLTFAELRDAFRGFKSLRSHGMAKGFRSLGWNVVELFPDFRELQEKWVSEHDLTVTPENWRDEITMAQLEHHHPEAVFCDDVSRLPGCLFEQRPAYVRVFAAMQGFPMHFERLAHADIVFTCTPSILMAFRDCGIKTELVYHSFDPSVLDDLPPGSDKHGFVFSGHSGYGFDWHHRTRYNLLHWLLEHSPLEAWLTERDLTLFPDMETPLREMFPHNTQPSVYGMDMYRLLNDSKVVLNIHADAAYGHSGNMRIFEATGIGACLLTEHSLNIQELFEPDVEVVTYRSQEECREKALYLLEHDDLRHDIGMRARQRTMRDHLARHRTEQMHECMRVLL